MRFTKSVVTPLLMKCPSVLRLILQYPKGELLFKASYPSDMQQTDNCMPSQLSVCVCVQGQQFRDNRRREDQEEIQRLQQQVKIQSQQAEEFRREIYHLSLKGVHVLPPNQAQRPRLTPLLTSAHCTHTAPGRPSQQVKAQQSPSKQEAN